MSTFRGEYEATVDAKGRFLLPAGIKKKLPEGTATFMLNRGIEKCLTLYTLEGWETIEQQVSHLNDFDEETRVFRRKFLGGVTEIELDVAGRMLLPPSLKEYAGLTKDIILVGLLNKIEIWDSAKYNQLFEDFSSETYSKLAAKVMGSHNKDSNT